MLQYFNEMHWIHVNETSGSSFYLRFRLFSLSLFKKFLRSKLEDGSQLFFIERV